MPEKHAVVAMSALSNLGRNLYAAGIWAYTESLRRIGRASRLEHAVGIVCEWTAANGYDELGRALAAVTDPERERLPETANKVRRALVAMGRIDPTGSRCPKCGR